MSAPKTEKEVRSFLGHLNYIARLISRWQWLVNQFFICSGRKILEFGIMIVRKPLIK
jgi:hypothetical protein